MQILDEAQIIRKTKRLALQIAEHNLDAKRLFVGGINTNGQRFAQMLIKELESLNHFEVITFQINLSPANPLESPTSYGLEVDRLSGERILIVDDVANTGRTLFYACKPLMHVLPRLVEVAVLVDRKHKFFPIKVDYVGLSLSTTIQDNIRVKLEEEKAAFLD